MNKLKDISNLAMKKVFRSYQLNKTTHILEDKTSFLEQAKLWNQKKLKYALNKSYEVELKIKSNSSVNKDILIKKLLLDICLVANS